MYVKELDLFVTVKLLDDTPAVLSLGKLCEDHGYSFEWTRGQSPHLSKHGSIIQCNTGNYVPIVVPGLSTGSSSSTTSTSTTTLPQDIVDFTFRPAITQSQSTSSRELGDQFPESRKNKIKEEDIDTAQGDLLRDLPDWLEEFTDNLVDEKVPSSRDTPTSSSRESDPEPVREVVSGTHSMHTHFPKDPNFEICKRTKITRAPCRRRTGKLVPRAESFGDLLTVDHKVLSEGCESRNNHRYAVVVHDLPTQWIQAYPCKTKTSQETESAEIP